VSEGERRHPGISEGSGAYGEGAETTQVELEAQRRELEAAGWERLDRRTSLSGATLGAAICTLRERL
jgi:hypothetical protein